MPEDSFQTVRLCLAPYTWAALDDQCIQRGFSRENFIVYCIDQELRRASRSEHLKASSPDPELFEQPWRPL